MASWNPQLGLLPPLILWPTCLAAKYSVASLRNSTRIICKSCRKVVIRRNFDVWPSFFGFSFRASEVLSVWNSALFQIARRKILQKFFQVCCLFWRDKRGVSKTMIALEAVVQGKLMTFREFLVYLEFRLVSTVHHDFFTALRVSQLQVSNLNLLRDKLLLQW